MYGVKVVSITSALALLMAQMGATPALADTIEAALVRAYQNNRSSMRSAHRCDRPTKTFRRRFPVIVRRSP